MPRSVAHWPGRHIRVILAPLRPAAPLPPPMPSYLSIEALTVSYGATRVLDHVSLGVERG